MQDFSFVPVDKLHPDWQTIIQPPKKAAPAKKKKNFLESLIPAVGGTGGALGGAALGSAILPGAGTLVGALLGGALGGGAGKVGENALEHEKLTSGVAGQAALNAALGIGPIRAAKFGVNAVKGAAGGKGLIEALTGAGDSAVAPGVISRVRSGVANKGAQLESRSGGFGVGEKLNTGKQAVGSKGVEDLLSTIKNEGIKPGAPEFRQKQVEDLIAKRGDQLKAHIAENNVKVAAPARKAIAGEFMDKVNSTAAVDAPMKKAAKNLVDNFHNQVKDAESLVKFRRGLDDAINFNKNPDSAEISKQAAAKAFRSVLKKQEHSLLGDDYKALNKSYSSLTKVNDALLNASRKVANQSEGGGGGLVGRLFASDTSQAIKSKGGAALQKAAPKSANPLSLKAIGTREGLGGLAGALSQSAGDLAAPPAQAASPGQDLSQSPLLQDSPAGGPVQPAQPDNPYGESKADIFAAMKNALAQGNTKAFGNLKVLYDIVDKETTPAQGKGLSSTQQQQANNAVSGLESLQTIADTLKRDPHAAGKAALPGGSLTSNLTGTASYKAAVLNATDVIGRLRSGGAINADEEKRFIQMLPAAFDKPEAVNYKLAALADLFKRFANPTPSNSLADTLTNLQ